MIFSPLQFRLLAVVLTAFTVSASACAQPKDLRPAEPIAVNTLSGKAFTHEIVSAYPEEIRRFTVHLPKTYDPSGFQRYPVLFLLDGQNAQSYVPGIMQVFADRDRAPEFIIVSLPSNGTRSRDYTPAIDENGGVTVGGADQFLDYLKNELIPFIDANYRTKTFRILSGESRGGLLALHSLITRPDMFNARFIFSPAIWHNDQEIIGRLETFLAARPRIDGSLYMNVGLEGEVFRTAFDASWKLFQKYPPEGMNLTIEELTEDHHGLTSIIGHHIAFRSLFVDWRTPFDVVETKGAQGVKDSFEAMSKRLGYNFEPSEGQLNSYGYTFLQRGALDTSIGLFKLSTELYPQSPNAYDSMAEGLLANGDVAEALRYSDRALALARASEHPRVDEYQERNEQMRSTSERSDNTVDGDERTKK